VIRDGLEVARHDLRLEIRGRHVTTLIVPFAVSLLLVLGLAFGPGRTSLQEAAPAVLWVAVLLAAILALRAGYEAEIEDDALEELVLSPIDGRAIFLGKVLAIVVELIVVAAVTIGTTSLGFDIGGVLVQPVVLAAVLVGVIGIACVGQVFALLAVRADARESLLPVLVLPACVPVVLAGVQVTAHAVEGSMAGAVAWLEPLVAFAVASCAIGLLVFERMMEV
jgi:heme exporter protein B